jgi:hypothetical protein
MTGRRYTGCRHGEPDTGRFLDLPAALPPPRIDPLAARLCVLWFNYPVMCDDETTC